MCFEKVNKYKEINQLMMQYLDLRFKDLLDKDKEKSSSLLRKIIDKLKLIDEQGYKNKSIDIDAENLDFLQLRSLIYKLITGSETIKNIKLCYHSYRKAMITDAILDVSPKINEIKNSKELFCREYIDKNSIKKQLVYFDYNIFVKCEEDEDIKNEVIRRKRETQFCYSGAHIEEVYKRKDFRKHKNMINLIEEITDSIAIFFTDKNRIDFLEKNQNLLIKEY